jgi:hypothetical protein
LSLLLIVRELGLVVFGNSTLAVNENIYLDLWNFPKLIVVLIAKNILVSGQEISIRLFERLSDLIELSFEVVFLVNLRFLKVESTRFVSESALFTRNGFRVELR